MITDDVDTEEPVREGEQNEAPKQKKVSAVPSKK